MACEITEVDQDGYSTEYDNGDVTSDTGCSYVEVGLGSFHTCDITNSLNEVDIEVTKVWIDENPQFNANNYAEAYWSCDNTAFCDDGPDGRYCDSGYLQFLGNPGEDSFSVFPVRARTRQLQSGFRRLFAEWP